MMASSSQRPGLGLMVCARFTIGSGEQLAQNRVGVMTIVAVSNLSGMTGDRLSGPGRELSGPLDSSLNRRGFTWPNYLQK